jgi:hypothetical protein
MDDEIVRAANAKKGSPFLNTDQAAHYVGLSRRTLEKIARRAAARAFASMAATSATTSTTLTDGRRSTARPRPRSPTVTIPPGLRMAGHGDDRTVTQARRAASARA